MVLLYPRQPGDLRSPSHGLLDGHEFLAEHADGELLLDGPLLAPRPDELHHPPRPARLRLDRRDIECVGPTEWPALAPLGRPGRMERQTHA